MSIFEPAYYSNYNNYNHPSEILTDILNRIGCKSIKFENYSNYNHSLTAYNQSMLSSAVTNQVSASCYKTTTMANIVVDYGALEQLALMIHHYEKLCIKLDKEEKIITQNESVKEAYDSYITLLSLYSE